MNAAKLSQSFDSLAKGDKASILAREMYELKILAFKALHFIFAIIASANSLVLSFVAPVMRRSRS
jgi:hypothetical protein